MARETGECGGEETNSAGISTLGVWESDPRSVAPTRLPRGQ